MFIKSIVIEGVEEDVKISHTEMGAEVTIERFTRRAGKHDVCIASIARDEDRESRFAKAKAVAAVILGTDRHGRPLGTNSMIHEVMTEMERVAGC
ncbi:MAG: hypothetical protein IT432_15940 [Phycisphaerales bacterium]|nr:hypothetical protein [Phycisphaerales bacterium]